MDGLKMSLEQPDPKVPNPQPLAKPEEEEEKPEQVEVQDEEEEEDDDAKAKETPSDRRKRISVTMFGAISGEHKCPICSSAHQYFSKPISWKKFKYKHIDIMSDKGLKVAKQQGITQMPFFRIRRPGEHRDEWIEGFNSVEWEEMKV